jgi:hypothetical protein
MRNPYKPYRHTDRQWYLAKRGKFYRGLGEFATKEQAALGAVKVHGRELQEALDKCNAYVEKHDPDYRDTDPHAYLA